MAQEERVMEHPLFTNLARQAALNGNEVHAIDQVPFRILSIPKGHDLVREGDDANSCIVVIRGLLATTKVNELARRQISAFHIAGDMPDLMNLHLDVRDNDLRALSGSEVARLDHKAMLNLCATQPKIAMLLWRRTLTDASIITEWLLNIASRPALNRLSHLFCEMLTRLEAAGLADGSSCPLPLTQTDLSEASGMSNVHVNRSLQELRAQKLITFEKGFLTVLDWDTLASLAGFDPSYLHLKQQRLRTRRGRTSAALN